MSSRTMNTDPYEVFREVGFDEKQAAVLTTAIPDVEPHIEKLRSEMDRRFNRVDLEFERVHTRFAQLDARIHRQTNVTIFAALGIVGTMIAVAQDLRGLF